MAKKDELGRWGEAVAAEHLRGRGYRIVERNWRCPHGEVDIVASEGGYLVVVEVKTRSTSLYGHPFEAITPVKLGRLHRLGLAWRSSTGSRTGPVRIDVVAIVGRPDAPTPPKIEIFRGVRA